ncbi:MAG: alpha-mannosidase [Ruminococcaceae bacterium]|nr:alpha-mannosidase [Oscillospiraceae bacterium]
MTYLEKIKALISRKGEGSNSERICSEIIYLDGISKNNEDRYNNLIEQAVDFLLAQIEKDGVITLSSVYAAEKILEPMAKIAREYTLLFISHAHIDMNWMWGYNETASITVDTFRTILNLMEEYPEFTYAQSQASTYEIIEKFAPHMLDDIKARIKEGRWEVTAAEWVEADKNMPNGESLTRQILQSKKYLSRLLEISEDSICIDFVPDTFGHNANIPEILSNAGIRYLYHCRGYETPCLYRFAAPSEKNVLAYREFAWYNGEITTEKFEAVPDFCNTYGLDTALCVYGVGDHGGGPSRRDIERILKYRTWPFTPTLRFGTFREFFESVEKKSAPLATVDHELNFLFTGCYTTQSRIKMANRIAEARINEAEALTSMDSLLGGTKRCQENFDTAWRNLLFNHFHDILPGSGTIETREYAMGRFQDTMAAVAISSNTAMHNIASLIDTSSIKFDSAKENCSEGGGVGFFQSYAEGYRMPSAERGRGSVRALHIFNPTPYKRNEYSEIVVWDYNYDISSCEIRNAQGEVIPFCVINSGRGYWGHSYTTLLVKAEAEPYGYTTIVLAPKKQDGHCSVRLFTAEHADTHINDNPIVMENNLIRAVFDHRTMQLTELTDKATGEKLISEPSCFFRLIEENPIYNMTSWRVGPYMNVKNLNATESVRITSISNGKLLQKVSYTIAFGSSVLNAEVSLKEDSPRLELSLNIDWNESPVRGVKIPQLGFAVPVSYETTGECLYDIPYGIIKRTELAHDVPSLSFLAINGKTEHAVGIISDCKYGYRFYEKIGSVTLIRSSYDPDPYPERGIHNIRLGVVCADISNMKKEADIFNHPLPYASGTSHAGKLPLKSSILAVDGNINVSCIKNSEDGLGNVIRIYDTTGQKQEITVSLCKNISKAYITDSNENILSEISAKDNTLSVTVDPFATLTIKIID